MTVTTAIELFDDCENHDYKEITKAVRRFEKSRGLLISLSVIVRAKIGEGDAYIEHTYLGVFRK